jgi:hypothetical protein
MSTGGGNPIVNVEVNFIPGKGKNAFQGVAEDSEKAASAAERAAARIAAAESKVGVSAKGSAADYKKVFTSAYLGPKDPTTGRELSPAEVMAYVQRYGRHPSTPAPITFPGSPTGPYGPHAPITFPGSPTGPYGPNRPQWSWTPSRYSQSRVLGMGLGMAGVPMPVHMAQGIVGSTGGVGTQTAASLTALGVAAAAAAAGLAAIAMQTRAGQDVVGNAVSGFAANRLRGQENPGFVRQFFRAAGNRFGGNFGMVGFGDSAMGFAETSERGVAGFLGGQQVRSAQDSLRRAQNDRAFRQREQYRVGQESSIAHGGRQKLFAANQMYAGVMAASGLEGLEADLATNASITKGWQGKLEAGQSAMTRDLRPGEVESTVRGGAARDIEQALEGLKESATQRAQIEKQTNEELIATRKAELVMVREESELASQRAQQAKESYQQTVGGLAGMSKSELRKAERIQDQMNAGGQVSERDAKWFGQRFGYGDDQIFNPIEAGVGKIAPDLLNRQKAVMEEAKRQAAEYGKIAADTQEAFNETVTEASKAIKTTMETFRGAMKKYTEGINSAVVAGIINAIADIKIPFEQPAGGVGGD